MKGLCTACLAGPRGEAGHDDLLGQSAGSQNPFRCGGCGTFWVRFPAELGGRAWVLVTEPIKATASLGFC